MNNLPTEILFLIFDNFSSLKDLSNCSDTCVRWKEIIETLYPAKVLVATGRRRNQTNIQMQANAEVIEIIDLIDHKGPIIYFFDGRYPSRHEQNFFIYKVS